MFMLRNVFFQNDMAEKIVLIEKFIKIQLTLIDRNDNETSIRNINVCPYSFSL